MNHALVTGASLRYRRAIERLLDRGGRSRLARLRATLANASRQYNLIKRQSQVTASRRSMSWRTVS